MAETIKDVVVKIRMEVEKTSALRNAAEAAGVKAIEKAFADAAKQVKSADGRTGKATVVGRLDYEAFRLTDDEPCVAAAREAVAAIGLAPRLDISNGGLDANWMAANGVPTVTLGCGQMDIHTTDEKLDLAAFENACRVALRLATAAGS